MPDEILFTVNYLGSPQVSFTLNFSKSGVHVIGQYYQLLRLDKSGFRHIASFAISLDRKAEVMGVFQMKNLTKTSDWLAKEISEIVDTKGKIKFELLGDNLGGKGLPLVAWHLKEKEEYDGAYLINMDGFYVFSISAFRICDCEDSEVSWMDRYVSSILGAIH